MWEPVLRSDWGSPSASTLGRIPDPRAVQFWDKGRLLSHAMGEHDRKSIVWDQVMVYGAGTVWNGRPPQPLYQGKPVVRVAEAARAALARAVESIGKAN